MLYSCMGAWFVCGCYSNCMCGLNVWQRVCGGLRLLCLPCTLFIVKSDCTIKSVHSKKHWCVHTCTDSYEVLHVLSMVITFSIS